MIGIMKIVLFSTMYTSPFSILCSLVTGCSISHGGIIQDGVLYDATFTRGDFNSSLLKDSNRQVTVYDFPDIDATDFINANLGVKYDTLGLLSYPLRIINKTLLNSETKMYCFEAVSRLLHEQGMLDSEYHSHVSGRNLLNIFNNNLDMVGTRMTQTQLIKRHLS